MYDRVPHESPMPVEAREGIGFLETKVTDGCDPVCECWELNPSPWEEQQY